MLLPALAASLTAQGGAAAIFVLTRPEPVPALTVRFEGEGEGSVLVTLAGQSTPLARCTKRCKVEIPAGAQFSIDAIPAEGATFGGFHAYPVRPPAPLVRYLGDPLAPCTPKDPIAGLGDDESDDGADDDELSAATGAETALAEDALAAADPEAALAAHGGAAEHAHEHPRRLRHAKVEDALQCRTALVTDTSISVEFGLIPGRVDVAILTDLEKLVTPKAPQPPAAITAEKLDEEKPVEVEIGRAHV
jgi:hypothetical protein